MEKLYTSWTLEERHNGVKDEFGVFYSTDGERLTGCEYEARFDSYTVRYGTKIICDSAFSNKWLKQIEFPDTVIAIGDRAFESCYFERVELPISVTTIGKDAFNYCTNLEQISLPNALKSIGKNAFWSCYHLTEITIPASVEEIGDGAFSRCVRLTAIKSLSPRFVVQDNFLIDRQEHRLITYFGNAETVIVPDTIKIIGYEAFDGCDAIHEIVLPESVTKIGESAFDSCENLQKINIPRRVKTIGKSAFSSCKALQEIVIPQSVTTISGHAFYGCSSLKEVTVPDSVKNISNSVFDDCHSLEKITLPDTIRRIGDFAFAGCYALKELVIPQSVITMGDNPFCQSHLRIECRSPRFVFQDDMLIDTKTRRLISCLSDMPVVKVPESVKIIGNDAFRDSKEIRKVSLPNTITRIGFSAFFECGQLRTINLPDSLKFIDYDAFECCYRLHRIVVSEKEMSRVKSKYMLESYQENRLCLASTADCCKIKDGVRDEFGVVYSPDGERLLHCENDEIDSYSIRKGTKIICDGAFEYSNPRQIEIPDTVTTIGNLAFFDCPRLEQITLPDSVVSIGFQAFEDCKSLQKIVIPQSVAVIADATFRGCDSLHEVIFPQSIRYIGSEAFAGCKSLEKADLPNSYLTIGDAAFACCGRLEQLTLPKNTVLVFKNPFVGCGSLTLASEDKDYIVEYDMLTYRDQRLAQVLISYLGNAETLDIPSFVEGHTHIDLGDSVIDRHYKRDVVNTIGNSAFAANQTLKKISLPESVIRIEDGAFIGSSIEEIVLPNSLESIGEWAFDQCGNLKRIVVPEDCVEKYKKMIDNNLLEKIVSKIF